MRLKATMRAVGAVLAAAAVTLTGCSTATDTDQDSSGSADGGRFEVTDVAGRTVEFDHAPERVILGESRSIFATGILDREDPLDKVVALGTDMQSSVSDYWKRFVEARPEAAELPEIGSFKKGDVTVENLVAQRPDVVIMSDDQYQAAKTGGLTEGLDNAGIKYVVTDFRAKPLKNTTRSMEIFGAVLGKQKAAEEFNAKYTEAVDLVRQRVAETSERPSTFVWRSAGLADCCRTWHDSNLSELVNAAGGRNIGDEFIDGESGDVTPEQVIRSAPEHVIVTGGNWGNKKDKDGKTPVFASAGYGVSAADSQRSMQAVLASQAGFDLLKAPEEGNYHLAWHQFYDSPLNYVALLQFAKWLHPEQFADVDVEAQWREAHDKWVPIAPDGSFFATAEK